MKHRIYMRDWYFNAGIVGFLRVISDDAEPEKLDKIKGLGIGGNYIEFDNNLLKNYRERFLKHAFIMLMNLDVYKNKFKSLIKKIEEDKGKKVTVKKIISQFSSSYIKFNIEILEKDFSKIKNIGDLLKILKDSISKTDKIITHKLFDKLMQTKKGKAYLDWFLDSWQLRGFVSTGSFNDYTKQITADNKKKLKNNDICLSCQKLKAENEFSNSISNIIGFNKDNSNWIWGFKSNKMKLCGLCSIVYSSALLSMVKLNKYVNENRVDCYYFLNRNSDIKTLYKTIQFFQKYIKITDVSNLTFFQIIRETIFNILKKQSDAVIENINFIEIIENPVLAGQSSKGYNIHSYRLTTEHANFFKIKLSQEKSIPAGYYKIREGSYSITDELISKTIQNQLGYTDLSRYYDYYMRKNIISHYNIYYVSNYIFNHINSIIKGGHMEENKTVIKKAFGNGKELREKITAKKRENQIDGIVYALLNDLKISNREGFLDKYIRLMMSNGLNARFGNHDEMADSDRFLQFGYSFINGLLNKPYDADNVSK